MSFFIQVLIVLTLNATISFGWNNCVYSPMLDILNQCVIIVSFICQEMLCYNSSEQFTDWDAVMGLATCKKQANRITQGIYNSMNFGRQASSASSDGLCLAPPFAPAEC